MAVDTRQKRFSMMNFSWVPSLVLFEADGSVDADDRAHLLNLYSGIALAGAVDVSGTRRQRQIKSLIKRNRRKKC